MAENPDKFDNEIDLLSLFNLFSRNKKLIIYFSIISILFGLIRAFTIPRTWQGEFQIVVNDTKSNPISNLSIPLLGFSSGLQKSELKTEIEIIKSPSVLLNIYEYVKNEKDLKELRFDIWKKSIDIKAEEGTKVLNIKYKDKDKKIILPVLNKISTTYQDYSGKERRRAIELNTNFYKTQIPLLRETFNKSINDATKFASKYDLGVVGLNQSDEIPLYTPLEIEDRRIEESNNLRIINKQIETISNKDVSLDEIRYIAEVGSINPSVSNSIKMIRELDNELANLKVVFTDNEISVKNLKSLRLKHFDNLRQNLKGSLNADKTQILNRIEAYKRPPELLAKYQQLVSEVQVNRLSLSKMELEYQDILIEKEREQDPWELITKPSLLPYAVEPNKKMVLLISFLIGLSLSLIASLIKERKENIIFSIDEITTLLSIKLIGEIPTKNDSLRKEYIELFSKNILKDIEGNIAIYYFGDISLETINSIKNDFKSLLKNNKLILTSNLIEAFDNKNIFIMTSTGKVKRDEIIQLNKKVILNKNALIGLISLN